MDFKDFFNSNLDKEEAGEQLEMEGASTEDGNWRKMDSKNGLEKRKESNRSRGLFLQRYQRKREVQTPIYNDFLAIILCKTWDFHVV
jgi:hypothetical protein